MTGVACLLGLVSRVGLAPYSLLAMMLKVVVLVVVWVVV